MIRPALLLVSALAVLTACSPGNHGALQPEAAADITLVSTGGLPNDTARLSSGGVTADVTGLWSDQGESVEIRYRSQTAADVPIASGSTWNGQSAPATAAWDRSAPEPGNALGRPLLGAGPLHLKPKATTIVQIEYDRQASGLAIGDKVIILVPMPGGSRAVRFRVAGE